MAVKTVHVFPSNGAWAVKKAGQKAETFDTKREAVGVAVHHARKNQSGQLVVHSKDGRVSDYRTYGLPKVQNPPKPGSLGSKKIAKAVGKVLSDRLHSDPTPPRAAKSEK